MLAWLNHVVWVQVCSTPIRDPVDWDTGVQPPHEGPWLCWISHVNWSTGVQPPHEEPWLCWVSHVVWGTGVQPPHQGPWLR